MKTLSRSTVFGLLESLGIADAESVFQVVIDAGHVTVKGYQRDQLDTFEHQGPTPAVWTQVFPIDVEA